MAEIAINTARDGTIAEGRFLESGKRRARRDERSGFVTTITPASAPRWARGEFGSWVWCASL